MPPVSICVLAYGDYLDLITQAVESIRKHCDRKLYRLLVGANEVSQDTLEYLTKLHQTGDIDWLEVSSTNIYTEPMRRRLFSQVDTEFIWWFDDDSYITEPDALTRRLEWALTDPKEIVVWGEVWGAYERDFVQWSGPIGCYGANATPFVLSAAWFRGRSLSEKWIFATGGCMFIRTSSIRLLDWPDPRLIECRAGDILFGEAIRQQNWGIRDIGLSGVLANTFPRRGITVEG